MTSLPILDLVAGMIFIYFMMSIICQSVFEGISSIRHIRAKMLEKWIVKNFPKLLSNFMDNTVLNALSKKGRTTQYISPSNFSMVLIDSITKEAGKIPQTLEDIRQALIKLEEEKKDLIPADFNRALKIFISEAQQASVKAGQTKTEIELFKLHIEKWFDSMMERVGGRYKRKSSMYVFVIALTATVLLNVDSIKIANYLYADKDARANLAALAYSAPADSNAIKAAQVSDTTVTKKIRTNDSLETIIQTITISKQQVDSNVARLGSLIPIGWNKTAEYNVFFATKNVTERSFGNYFLFWLLKCLGLLVTVFAITLGTPFWFDVLNKVANLRNSIKPGASIRKK